MKKKLFGIGITCCLAMSVIAINYESNDKKFDLLQMNIEALTNIETSTTWNCDASSKTKCSASCPNCGTYVSGTGRLTGSHKCN